MNNPVCCKCNLEMVLAKVNVVALYMRATPPTPVEAYYADMFQCPKCKHEALIRFASCRHWSHFDGTTAPSINRVDVYPIFEEETWQK